jgi:hypothetical protein
MLDPDKLKALPTTEVVTQYSADRRRLMDAAWNVGVGRGTEIAHGLGIVGTLGAGIVYEKPSMLILTGICIVGTTLGHALHKRDDNVRLEADFNTNSSISELSARGYDLDQLS